MKFTEDSKGHRRTDKKGQKVFDLGYDKKNVHNLSQWWGLFGLLLVLGLFFVSKHLMFSLPTPITNKDQATHPNSFVSERAWHDLKILTSFGPRPTGAYSNDVLAVDFLQREISYIKQMAHKSQQIDVDVQKVSGAYWAGFKPHGMTNVYRNVQNVVVKLAGKSENVTNKSLMLNCHFDSVAGSPGASDDAASCCVMLEVLRVLSRQSELNRYSIVFLFNGAEETPLQAAHGFITQHPWAKHIQAFLNLESVGSGGKEILFQSGPFHPWLINMYKRAVPHPNAQVAAEEIFHSGLIPSDTDFRIFRDFGHVPGMDFAHVINGYRYHTKYDHIDYIPMDVIQRTGDNILALTKLIANSDELDNTKEHAQGKMVYFDILGLTFVCYSEMTGIIVNYAVALAAVLIPYFLLSGTTKGIHSKHIRLEILIGAALNILGFLVSAGVCYLVALELDFSGHTMSWYSHQMMAMTIYCSLTVLIQCGITYLCYSSPKAPLSLSLIVQARLMGTTLIWAVLTAVVTTAGYKIAYVFMVPLLVTLFSSILIGMLGFQNSIRKWMYVHVVGQMFVILWASHFYHLVMGMFIPIAGRSGAGMNPDITIGLVACGMTFFITSYLTPLIILLRRVRNFVISLLVVFLISRYLASTHIGFPYRDDLMSDNNPTPQRHFITHTLRTLYDEQGHVRYTDSGFWIRELDRNARRTIESLAAPDMPIDQHENVLCKDEVFCALPFYSCRQLHTTGFWMNGPAPLVRENAKMQMNSKMNLDSTHQRLNLTITGSFLYSIQIRPKSGVKLVNWNILDTMPEPNIYNGQAGYFVMVTHGVEAPPFDVVLEFESQNAMGNRAVVDINVVTFHWEYHKEHTPTFASILAKVPRWAFAVPAVAALEGFTF